MHDSSSSPVSEGGEQHGQVAIRVPRLKDGSGTGNRIRPNAADFTLIVNLVNHCVYA